MATKPGGSPKLKSSAEEDKKHKTPLSDIFSWENALFSVVIGAAVVGLLFFSSLALTAIAFNAFAFVLTGVAVTFFTGMACTFYNCIEKCKGNAEDDLPPTDTKQKMQAAPQTRNDAHTATGTKQLLDTTSKKSPPRNREIQYLAAVTENSSDEEDSSEEDALKKKPLSATTEAKKGLPHENDLSKKVESPSQLPRGFFSTRHVTEILVIALQLSAGSKKQITSVENPEGKTRNSTETQKINKELWYPTQIAYFFRITIFGHISKIMQPQIPRAIEDKENNRCSRGSTTPTSLRVQ